MEDAIVDQESLFSNRDVIEQFAQSVFLKPWIKETELLAWTRLPYYLVFAKGMKKLTLLTGDLLFLSVTAGHMMMTSGDSISNLKTGRK